MLLHAAIESTPERRATTHNWSPSEMTQEEHFWFLVNSPGYDERTRELSKQAGPQSIQKASKLGHAAESEVNNSKLRSQLGRMWEKLLLEDFETSNPLTRTEVQLMFTWCLAEVPSEDLNSCDKMRYPDKIRLVYQIMMQYVASISTRVNTRASGNKSLMVPLRRDSRGTLLAPGG